MLLKVLMADESLGPRYLDLLISQGTQPVLREELTSKEMIGSSAEKDDCGRGEGVG